MTTQDERYAQARAHRDEKAFVSREIERIDQAGSKLRGAIFLAPSPERSAICADVADALEASARELRSRI